MRAPACRRSKLPAGSRGPPSEGPPLELAPRLELCRASGDPSSLPYSSIALSYTDIPTGKPGSPAHPDNPIRSDISSALPLRKPEKKTLTNLLMGLRAASTS